MAQGVLPKVIKYQSGVLAFQVGANGLVGCLFFPVLILVHDCGVQGRLRLRSFLPYGDTEVDSQSSERRYDGTRDFQGPPGPEPEPSASEAGGSTVD